MVATRFMQRAQDCGICKGLIAVQGVLNSCTHAFCLECVLKWAEIENSCPICKRRFRTVTTRWARKCLKETSNMARLLVTQQRQFEIEEKSQNSHTSMVYETGQYTIRVMFPPGGETQFAGLLRYLEELIRGTRGQESVHRAE